MKTTLALIPHTTLVEHLRAMRRLMQLRTKDPLTCDQKIIELLDAYKERITEASLKEQLEAKVFLEQNIVFVGSLARTIKIQLFEQCAS